VGGILRVSPSSLFADKTCLTWWSLMCCQLTACGGKEGRLRLVASPIDQTSFIPSSVSHNLPAFLLPPHLLLSHHQQYQISFGHCDFETKARIMNSCSCSMYQCEDGMMNSVFFCPAVLKRLLGHNIVGVVSPTNNLWLSSSSLCSLFFLFLQMVRISCE